METFVSGRISRQISVAAYSRDIACRFQLGLLKCTLKINGDGANPQTGRKNRAAEKRAARLVLAIGVNKFPFGVNRAPSSRRFPILHLRRGCAHRTTTRFHCHQMDHTR